MTTAIVGNAPVRTYIKNVDVLYVFNNLRALSQMVLGACPRRIVHVWNRLYRRIVTEKHQALIKRCPNSNITLRTNEGMHVKHIVDYGLPSNVRNCFSAVTAKTGRPDGHPWSLGFYVMASLVAQNVTPLFVFGFTHQAWKGHPMQCERLAVDVWNETGVVIRH